MTHRVACNHCGQHRDVAVTLACSSCGQRSWTEVKPSRGDLIVDDVIAAAQAMDAALLRGDTITRQSSQAHRLAEACKEYARVTA